MSKMKLETFWAIALQYQPFNFGGDLHRPVRFLLTGEPKTIEAGKGKKTRVYEGYLTFFAGAWRFYEKETGGLLGDSKIKAKCLVEALLNIESTPDLLDQMKTFKDVMRHPAIKTEEAERLLSKGRK